MIIVHFFRHCEKNACDSFMCDVDIFDAKAMKAQKMPIVHCYKQYEKNTCNGLKVNVFFFPPSFDMWKG
jgi:hypothetical protein